MRDIAGEVRACTDQNATQGRAGPAMRALGRGVDLSGETSREGPIGVGRIQAGFQKVMECRWNGMNGRHQRKGKGKLKGIMLSEKEHGLFRDNGSSIVLECELCTRKISQGQRGLECQGKVDAQPTYIVGEHGQFERLKD